MTLESKLIRLVSSLAPWLAPLPTAYVVMQAAVNVLAWPAWVAMVAAVIIETISLATTHTGLELFAYNRGKRKSDPSAPAWVAWVCTAAVIAAQSALIVALDARPVLLLFQAFSAAAVVNLALRADHSARVATIDAEKRERSEARSEARRAGETVKVLEAPAPALLSDGQRVGQRDDSETATVIVAAATLAACPKCGRSDFSNRYQRSGHVGKCKP